MKNIGLNMQPKPASLLDPPPPRPVPTVPMAPIPLRRRTAPMGPTVHRRRTASTRPPTRQPTRQPTHPLPPLILRHHRRTGLTRNVGSASERSVRLS